MPKALPSAALLAALALVTVAACSSSAKKATGSSPSSGSSPGSSAASSTGSAAGGPTKPLDKVTIGFAQREVDAPYYSAMVKQAQQIAKDKGFKLLVQNAASDPVTQINQINTMVSQGVDLIVVNAVSPKAEQSQLAAVAKKTPLMFIDTAIPGVGFTAVQSDNEAIGTLAGQLMAKRFGSGKTANLAILNGGPTDEIVGPGRQKGFLAGLQKGGVTVNVVASAEGDYSKDKAVPAAENMLAAHSNINMLLGLNDAMALGGLDVIKQKHKTSILVSGIDGQKEALQEIVNGGCTGQYVSTGLNSPSLATDAVMAIAAQVTTGQKKTTDYPATSFTKAVGIGCDNVKDYYDPSSVF